MLEKFTYNFQAGFIFEYTYVLYFFAEFTYNEITKTATPDFDNKGVFLTMGGEFKK
jgi:hypothetical protein